MEQLRKEGNELFKCGDYEGALTAYTQALGLGATPQDQAILHRNRAACHLKLVREPGAPALPWPVRGGVGYSFPQAFCTQNGGGLQWDLPSEVLSLFLTGRL